MTARISLSRSIRSSAAMRASIMELLIALSLSGRLSVSSAVRFLLSCNTGLSIAHPRSRVLGYHASYHATFGAVRQTRLNQWTMRIVHPCPRPTEVTPTRSVDEATPAEQPPPVRGGGAP